MATVDRLTETTKDGSRFVGSGLQLLQYAQMIGFLPTLDDSTIGDTHYINTRKPERCARSGKAPQLARVRASHFPHRHDAVPFGYEFTEETILEITVTAQVNVIKLFQACQAFETGGEVMENAIWSIVSVQRIPIYAPILKEV